jgi:hypothetical protein
VTEGSYFLDILRSTEGSNFLDLLIGGEGGGDEGEGGEGEGGGAASARARWTQVQELDFAGRFMLDCMEAPPERVGVR